MARKPDGLTTRERVIHVRVTDAMFNSIDLLKGRQSTSDYIRHLIIEDSRRSRSDQIKGTR